LIREHVKVCADDALTIQDERLFEQGAETKMTL